MPLNDDPIRLRHIAESSQEAMKYVEGVDQAQFDENRLLQHGVVRCIEIIGEAVSRLTPELREQHPQVPWARIVATRNRIVHAYFDLDLDMMWRTATNELPALFREIEKIRSTLKGTPLEWDES